MKESLMPLAETLLHRIKKLFPILVLNKVGAKSQFCGTYRRIIVFRRVECHIRSLHGLGDYMARGSIGQSDHRLIRINESGVNFAVAGKVNSASGRNIYSFSLNGKSFATSPTIEVIGPEPFTFGYFAS